MVRVMLRIVMRCDAIVMWLGLGLLLGLGLWLGFGLVLGFGLMLGLGLCLVGRIFFKVFVRG